MKPDYVNGFAMRKVQAQNGEILEVDLEATCKYMENEITVTEKGVENVSTPAVEKVASMVMNRQTALLLRDMITQTLGE